MKKEKVFFGCLTLAVKCAKVSGALITFTRAPALFDTRQVVVGRYVVILLQGMDMCV